MRKVSICIPAYGKPKQLERLIESVYSQTFKDYEIIVTDDSATNDVYEVIKRYPEIRYYKNKVRLGATVNTNYVMSLGSSDYIKIMHHDDWFTYRDSLEQMVNALDKERKMDAVFCGGKIVSSMRKRVNILDDMAINNIEKKPYELFCANILGGPSCMLLRQPISFLDENLVCLVDIDYFIRIIGEQKRFYYLNKALISYDNENDRLTNICNENSALMMYEYQYVYEKFDLYKYQKCKESILRIMVNGNEIRDEYDELRISKREVLQIFINKMILTPLIGMDEKIELLCDNFRGKIKNYLIQNTYNKIAIYGYGDIGKLLVYFLNQDIDITYIIDRSVSVANGKMKFYQLEDDLPETDLIIITIKKDVEEVKKKLCKKCTCTVKGLREILIEMKSMV